MSKAIAQLRKIQAACIVAVVACGALAYFGTNRTRHAGFAVELCISIAAVWAAAGGFTVQRKLASTSRPTTAKSTPFTRWRAGNIIRLWTAASVGIWALVLAEFGPLPVLSGVFFAAALLLLVFWTPGIAPAGPPTE
jgi:hypothetical protein